jgi:hypothetical protein
MKSGFLGNIALVTFFCLFFSFLGGRGAVQADLEISETVLDFSVITRPKSKSLTISVVNKTSSPYLGSIAIEKSWVTSSTRDLSLSTGKKQDITFTVDASTLEPGDYETHIYFRDLMGSTKAEIMVKCIVVVGGNDPILKVSHEKIDFKEVQRGEQPLTEFTLENSGSGFLKGTVQYPEWLRGDETIDLHFTQKKLCYMRANTFDFAPGSYAGDIKIETNGGNRTIPVSIKIIAKDDDPILSFEPMTVDFGTVKKGKKGRIKVKVVNKGKGRLSGTLTYPDWIEADEEFKEIEKNKEILLVADGGKLPLGLTKDVIKITTKTNGLLDIPVKIFVIKGK